MRSRRLKIAFGRVPLGDSGVAAVEFALVAPLFALAALGMIDVGLSVNERMEMDRSLRAGLQTAMVITKDVADIKSTILNANFSEQSSGEAPTIDVSTVCECASAGVPCGVLCDDGTAPSVFYRLVATKQMSTIIMPSFPVRSVMEIQIR